VGNLANIASVTNTEPATGGHEAETEEELRENIPSQVITRGRAVTRDDYRRLLKAFGEIAEVAVDHPQDNIVEVYIYPQGGGKASEELKQRVADYLDNIRMITEDVRILDFEEVPVDISIKLWISPNYDAAQVAQRAEQVLREELRKVEAARQLYPSDIYDLIKRSVPGVVKADLDLLARSGETGVEPIICEPYEIIVEGTVTVQVEEYGG